MAEDPRSAQPIDFVTFVLSLASTAFVHMGDAPHPDSGTPAENLAIAKQTIDILGMLEQKTKGNLTGDEEKFLENLLADLRIRFVEKSRGAR